MPEPAQARIDLQLVTSERGAIGRVTVHNEAKLNTLTRPLMQDFIAAVESLFAREDLRALIVTGTGEKAFIGGASIPEMAALDRESAEDYIRLVHRTCASLRACPVPVIARIDGYALGAGLEVAVSCDLRVATTRARFGMPEVKVGIPSVIEAALIPRLVGRGRARELLLLGEMIDADAALRFGLIERQVAPESLDAEIDKILAALLAAGPRAVRLQKRLMHQWENLPLDDAVEAGIEAFVRAFENDEPRRMLLEFGERKR